MAAPTGSPPRFLVALAAIVALVGGALAGFAARVDPFGAYPSVAKAELAPFRGDMDSRVVLAERLRSEPWTALVLGSSRAQAAIAPRHAAWGGARVYNGAVRAGRMFEARRALELALESAPLERVVLFVDFFSFHAGARTANDFARSRLAPDFNPVEYHGANLLGLGALEAALEVVRRADRDEPASVDGRGLRRFAGELAQGPPEVFRTVIANFATSPDMYGEFVLDAAALEDFATFVERCVAEEIDLAVAIAPVHATLLETVRALGLFDDYRAWKRGLAEALAPHPDVPLWDFTSYAGRCAEPVVPTHGKLRRATWFRDPSHMTRRFGDLVLEHLLGKANSGPVRRVTLGDLGAQFERLEAERAAWLTEHALDREYVSDLWGHTL